MKLSEFKAWFEGFTETMTAPPNEKQWDRIKARIAEIDGTPIVREVYVDRYVKPYYERWTPYYGVSTTSGTSYSSANNVQLLSAGVSGGGVSAEAGKDWAEAWRSKANERYDDAGQAMQDLGRIEYLASREPP